MGEMLTDGLLTRLMNVNSLLHPSLKRNKLLNFEKINQSHYLYTSFYLQIILYYNTLLMMWSPLSSNTIYTTIYLLLFYQSHIKIRAK